tara:strand:- start:395 stop:673 length:279 start_codon:yes stop_codon:yes gene_type:complete
MKTSEIENYSLDVLDIDKQDLLLIPTNEIKYTQYIINKVDTLDELKHQYKIWDIYAKKKGKGRKHLIRGFINYTDGDSKEIPREELKVDYIF